MNNLSVPLDQNLQNKLEELIESGVAPNKAAVMRKALERLAEERAVQQVLEAETEPALSGDLDNLADQL